MIMFIMKDVILLLILLLAIDRIQSKQTYSSSQGCTVDYVNEPFGAITLKWQTCRIHFESSLYKQIKVIVNPNNRWYYRKNCDYYNLLVANEKRCLNQLVEEYEKEVYKTYDLPLDIQVNFRKDNDFTNPTLQYLMVSDSENCTFTSEDVVGNVNIGSMFRNCTLSIDKKGFETIIINIKPNLDFYIRSQDKFLTINEKFLCSDEFDYYLEHTSTLPVKFGYNLPQVYTDIVDYEISYQLVPDYAHSDCTTYKTDSKFGEIMISRTQRIKTESDNSFTLRNGCTTFDSNVYDIVSFSFKNLNFSNPDSFLVLNYDKIYTKEPAEFSANLPVKIYSNISFDSEEVLLATFSLFKQCNTTISREHGILKAPSISSLPKFQTSCTIRFESNQSYDRVLLRYLGSLRIMHASSFNQSKCFAYGEISFNDSTICLHRLFNQEKNVIINASSELYLQHDDSIPSDFEFFSFIQDEDCQHLRPSDSGLVGFPQYNLNTARNRGSFTVNRSCLIMENVTGLNEIKLNFIIANYSRLESFLIVNDKFIWTVNDLYNKTVKTVLPLKIQFKDFNNEFGLGILMSYQLIKKDIQVNVSELHGVFTSKGYPGHIPRNHQDTIFFPKILNYGKVRLDFKEFQMQKSRNCKNDFVMINWRRHCGTEIIQEENVYDLPLEIITETGDQGTSKGFLFFYEYLYSNNTSTSAEHSYIGYYNMLNLKTNFQIVQ